MNYMEQGLCPTEHAIFWQKLQNCNLILMKMPELLWLIAKNIALGSLFKKTVNFMEIQLACSDFLMCLSH